MRNYERVIIVVVIIASKTRIRRTNETSAFAETSVMKVFAIILTSLGTITMPDAGVIIVEGFAAIVTFGQIL
jgi:hypothetical protein